MRGLLSNLLLESFLEPGSTDDIAAELVICCSRAFPDLPELAKIAPPVEEEEDNEEVPPVMDVLLDVLLSLLAKSSTPIRNAVEQVSLLIMDHCTESACVCVPYTCFRTIFSAVLLLYAGVQSVLRRPHQCRNGRYSANHK